VIVPTQLTSEATTRETLIRDALGKLMSVRAEMLALERSMSASIGTLHPSYKQSARNLLHYVALRRNDLRDLQLRLASLGLSSLGRAEAHALGAVEAVLMILQRLVGGESIAPSESAVDLARGNELLEAHTTALLGVESSDRTVRIMVTLPREAADSPTLVQGLMESGMDVVRINCAHDDEAVWARMIANLQKSEKAMGQSCRILMDLAGPKLRTGPIRGGPSVVKWRPERNALGHVTEPARVCLYPAGMERPLSATEQANLPVDAKWLSQLRIGDRVDLMDSRGARRFLWIVGIGGPLRWAEVVRTAYVTEGTVLKVSSRADHSTFPEPMATKVQSLPASPGEILLRVGDELVLTADSTPGASAQFDEQGRIRSPAHIGCTLPAIFKDLRAGQRIMFDDGKLHGVIETAQSASASIRITNARSQGYKLRADKGINLPDTELRLPALTEKDVRDIEFVAANADMVGYSFVRTADDIQQLESKLREFGGNHVGIVLKIETRQAFEQLPSLLLASMETPCDGVMIARGDLAIECGYERLAEVQEEILWVCEAAHVPVIWATQVLEGLTRDGMPSRAEISDAAIGQRAECVMLNKGRHIVKAVQTLDDILRRMQAHQTKKRSLLRPLEVARRFSAQSSQIRCDSRERVAPTTGVD
jgi:pyruvate kinase